MGRSLSALHYRWLSSFSAGGTGLVTKPLNYSVHGEFDWSGWSTLIAEGDVCGGPGPVSHVHQLVALMRAVTVAVLASQRSRRVLASGLFLLSPRLEHLVRSEIDQIISCLSFSPATFPLG